MESEMTENWFEKFRSNFNSAHGEDGILIELFNIIGTKNKFAVECGALNGLYLSNVRHFITEYDWSALMIEADQTAFEKLKENYLNQYKVSCLNSFIDFKGEETVDNIFSQHQVPDNLDLFVLDIDGNEYHIWESMKKTRPRVMVVEFNPSIPNDIAFIQPRDMSIQQGSSLRALTELAKSKKYRLVAVTDCNAFYVAEEEACKFKNLDLSIGKMRPSNAYETKIFQLYDGTLKIAGNTKLIWHNRIIDEKAIQALPKSQRIFLNGINSSQSIRNIKHYLRKTKIYPLIKLLRNNPFLRKVMK